MVDVSIPADEGAARTDSACLCVNQPGGHFPRYGSMRKSQSGEKRVSIATNPNVGRGLRTAWRRIECVSVAAYLQALSGAVAELKRDLNGPDEVVTSEFELLMAFDSAVKDRGRDGRGRDGSYSAAACRLLMAETKDSDAAFGEVEEAEAW